ncbi:MAG: hormogonium polysaccharide biosynthesis protein HpsA [Cyanobacteria bacterium J06627_8]
MGIRRQQKKMQRSSFIHSTVKNGVRWLLRVLLKVDRSPRWLSPGFVLPSTVLLLLIVTLTVGSISLRTLSRTTQAIGDRQQQVIYNVATPAIDRAKAKVEFLFDPSQDNRLPTGVPSEQQLLAMMLNRPPVDPANLLPDEVRQLSIETPDSGVAGTDPYTFPDERATANALGLPVGLDGRLDLNGDGAPDNAWVYAADTDNNGVDDALVAYSILFQTPANLDDLANSSDAAIAARADNLQVRNAPLSSIIPANPACQNRAAAPPIESGWFTDLAASRKNFQVDAVVIPVVEEQVANGQFVPSPTATTATLEFQQDRQYDEGNKWGAWFRNDLEIYSAPLFNWNGAMHTEGNLIVGRNNRFRAFLISSPSSCLYDRQSSEITIAEDLDGDAETGQPAFQGQVIAGQLFGVEANPRATFHIHGVPDPNTDGDDVLVQENTDSLVNNNEIAELSLDPVYLFTQDWSVPRAGIGAIDFATTRDADWEERDLAKADTGRVYNTGTQSAPRIDDFFRADNRLGPKPVYDEIPIAAPIGTQTNELRLVRNDGVDGNVGLDGYWERRARADGMRVIVGQRLELGNPFGWKGALYIDRADADLTNDDAPEPLYPWNDATCTDRCHEAKQRRTLRDNLAAVQSMAVYHSAGGNDDGDFPKLCMAVTAHPGMPSTIDSSTTFNPFPGALPVGVPNRDISFFDGHGTNGWEYPAPAVSPAAFAGSLAPGQPLGNTLRNLAHFAGDSNGGAPSFPPVQDNIADLDSVVHPYPNLSMWGDFSMLRRILNELDSGVTYANLSVADKTYLHTAACTVGMLASNVNTLNQFSYADVSNAADITSLQTAVGNAVTVLTDGNDDNGEIGTVTPPGGSLSWEFTHPDSGGSAVATVVQSEVPDVDAPPDAILAALSNPNLSDDIFGAGTPAAEQQRLARLAELIHLKEQILRDRTLGFASGLTCALTGQAEIERLCPQRPKFPSLYYLFPVENHLQDGSGNLQTADNQPDDEPYIVDSPYAFDGGDPLTVGDETGINAAYEYQVVDSTDATHQIAGVVLFPKAAPPATWLTPIAPATADSPNVINLNGTAIATSFMDKGVYNGRDLMGTRVLDLDLDLLRNNIISSGATSDTWIPRLSIVYAFREDAAREDMVVRPAAAVSCANDTEIQGVGCIMNGIGEFQSLAGTTNPQAQDPPLVAVNSISPKAVDYYADPDRRPNGFRLHNGENIERAGDDGRGLSFISDDPVYIQGDFNLHQDGGCGTDACRLEEFETKLPDDGEFTPDEFYGRDDLEVRFARQDTDSWRPTELLSDSITILSNNFCDGSAADVFLTAGGGSGLAEITPGETDHAGFSGYDISAYRCNGADNRTSYLNQNRPSITPGGDEIWMRENPFDLNSPIEVSRNGAPRYMEDLAVYPNDEYRGFDNPRSISDAAQTRVNAVLFNGIVPSRPSQSYGGLHNFPRLLEKWGEPPNNRTTLAISGAFIQLDFSNYATAPYDQEVWEPIANPTTLTDDELIRYYSPPTRAWGYDVGLQYVPAAPITRRFSNPGSFRSEFYTEPEANDAYVCTLRNVVGGILGSPANGCEP